MEKQVRTIKIITAISVVVMFICIIILTFQFIKIGNLRHKTNELTEYKAELVEQINNYNTTNQYYNNNRTEYLENYAREVLGWGQNGSTWYTSKK